ncbi:hypothetical protein NW752_011994 [Fusarium irregulare]|uniref:NACHT domain-containing protein n=1 Tax=Fusarium irregulare TaxID=2494466 RepID=A0A9W8PGZ7_9HYPO|nr:hypothetical protein NW752_011994 [Fusarium irregulare]KAJ4006401.1 hypothetical protein NW766_010488 [Fusarium irregulare]
MATGFEALGAVSAVFQVISFSAEIIALCKKIYDGKPTANDDLESHATRMSEAISRIEDRCKALQTGQKSTEAEMKLNEIAKSCQLSAQELQTEVRFVTDMQRKGSMIKVFRSVLRASSHRKKIERLELALSRCRQVMETEMLALICSQSDAQKLKQEASFHNLASDVQTLVVQIAQGYIKLEDSMRVEYQATRDTMIRQTADTQEAIKDHITTEVQRKELLQSLRSPEMKKRYNDLMDSSQATFSRVFASYDRITADGTVESEGPSHDGEKAALSRPEKTESGESDQNLGEEPSSLKAENGHIEAVWSRFTEWLKSDNPLFCILGKPGSGKSTLVKFVVDNSKTRSLLTQRSMDVHVLSHFFWKIGLPSQNSVKGLLCSLIHQIFHADQTMLGDAMSRYDLESYRHYDDWSERSLRTLLFHLFKLKNSNICIFIDGLDEICTSDGLSKLTQLVNDIVTIQGIKICVTSRPETLVVKWLAKRSVSRILLEDLTSTEMKTYLRESLRPICLENKVSDQTCDFLIYELVRKAQGVFLWLYLSLRSLKIGIESGDTDSMLIERLEGLPDDLEQLYSDMWKRMNESSPPHRDTAIAYFRYALQKPQRIWACFSVEKMDGMLITQPTVGQIMCAETPALQDAMTKNYSTFDRATIKYECMKTKRAIETRCAGMLEVKPPLTVQGSCLMHDEISLMWSGVVFIHRTAHDFLTDTEAGHAIMQRQSASEIELATKLLKGILAVFCVLHSRTEMCGPLTMVLEQTNQLVEIHGPEGLQEVVSMFPLLERLYRNGIIGTYHHPLPEPHFLGLLARYAGFHAFVTIAIKSPALASSPTDILRDALSLSPAWIFSSHRELVFPSLDLIQQLLTMGASVHTTGFSCRDSYGISLKYVPFVRIDTIFANVIGTGLLSLNLPYRNALLSESSDFSTRFIDCILSMAPTCPELKAPMLVRINVDRQHGAFHFAEILQREALASDSSQDFALVIETRLTLVLSYVLAVLKPLYHGVAISQVEDLIHKLDTPTPKLRFVISSTEHQTTLYERVDCEQSHPEIMDLFFQPDLPAMRPPITEADQDSIWEVNRIWSVIRTLSLTVTDAETAYISLADEELGIRTYPQAKIAPPESWLEYYNSNPEYPFPRILGELKALSTDGSRSL